MPTKPVRELERLTVLLDHAEIKKLKYMAVDQGVSTSEIVRSAVKNLSIRSVSEDDENVAAERSLPKITRDLLR